MSYLEGCYFPTFEPIITDIHCRKFLLCLQQSSQDRLAGSVCIDATLTCIGVTSVAVEKKKYYIY